MTKTHQPDTLTLAEVADELDVHYMTAYRYVRLGLLEATQIGRSWVVTRSALDAFRNERGDRASAKRGEADWMNRLLRRLLAGDEPGAWSTVEAALASGLSIREVYMSMLVPALHAIGDKWQSGEIDVADEHLASRIVDRIIGRLGPRAATRGVRRGSVVIGSTATEFHSLPITIAADMLRSARFVVVDLGANLPPKSFGKAVAAADSLVAVAVSVTTTGQEDELSRTIGAIRAETDRPIVVGGRGTDAATAKLLGADAYAATATDAIAAIELVLAESQ